MSFLAEASAKLSVHQLHPPDTFSSSVLASIAISTQQIYNLWPLASEGTQTKCMCQHPDQKKKKNDELIPRKFIPSFTTSTPCCFPQRLWNNFSENSQQTIQNGGNLRLFLIGHKKCPLAGKLSGRGSRAVDARLSLWHAWWYGFGLTRSYGLCIPRLFTYSVLLPNYRQRRNRPIEDKYSPETIGEMWSDSIAKFLESPR